MDIHYVGIIGQLEFSFSVNKYDNLIQCVQINSEGNIADIRFEQSHEKFTGA